MSLNNRELKFIGITIMLVTLLTSISVVNHKMAIIVLGIIVGTFIIANDNLYRYILFITLGLYLVLNQGVTNIGINVGIIIPLAEIVLVIGLIRGFIRNRTIFLKKSMFALVLIFCFVSIKIFIDFFSYGAIAFRDGVGFIEIMYIIVTYNELHLMKINNKDIDRLLNFTVKIVLNILFLYSLFYFQPDILKSISPVYYGYQKEIYVLGNFNSIHLWLLLLIVYNTFFIVNTTNIYKSIFIHIQNLISLSIIIVTTSRLSIIAYATMIVIFIIAKKYKSAFYLISYIFFGIVALLIILNLGIEIKLKRGYLNIDFINDFILSFVGKGDSGMAGGVNQRLEWYKEVVSYSIKYNTELFGRGFGMALINFVDGTGHIVREPHNSYLSIYARTGIITLIVWMIWIGKLLLNMFKDYLKRRSLYSLIGVATIIIALITASVEPYFELPYCTVPFYIIIGIVLYKYEEYKNKEKL